MDKLRGLIHGEQYEKVHLEDGDVSDAAISEDFTPPKRKLISSTKLMTSVNILLLTFNIFALIKLYIVLPQPRNAQLREQSFFCEWLSFFDIQAAWKKPQQTDQLTPTSQLPYSTGSTSRCR